MRPIRILVLNFDERMLQKLALLFFLGIQAQCLLAQGTVPKHIWSVSVSRFATGNLTVGVTSRLGTYHWLWFGGVQYQMPAQVTPVNVRKPSPMHQIAGFLNYRTGELLPSTWTNSAGITLGLQNVLFGSSTSGFVHGPMLSFDLNCGPTNYWQRDADLDVHVTGSDRNYALTGLYELGFRMFRVGDGFFRVSAAAGGARIREFSDHTQDAFYASTGAYRSQNRVIRRTSFFTPVFQFGISLNIPSY